MEVVKLKKCYKCKYYNQAGAHIITADGTLLIACDYWKRSVNANGCPAFEEKSE